jgi:hypothetical protein
LYTWQANNVPKRNGAQESKGSGAFLKKSAQKTFGHSATDVQPARAEVIEVVFLLLFCSQKRSSFR